MTTKPDDRHLSYAGDAVAMLRPLNDLTLAHSIFPASFGIAFKSMDPTGLMMIDMCWTCCGVALRASATVTLADLEPWRAALATELARTLGCGWRVSTRQTAEGLLVLEFANNSPPDGGLFSNVRVSIEFSVAPSVCSAVNCMLARPRERIAELTLWDVEAQSHGATPEQPALALSQLVQSPIPFLETVLLWMERAHDAQIDGSEFGECVRGFGDGVRWIEKDSFVSHAFRLTCETMLLVSADQPEYARDRWRLFQLIFLVTHLPTLIGRHGTRFEGEEVPVVYFPTGKGKTEAYLGSLVLLGFLERLHGVAGGVASWTRFPLRLLSEALMLSVAGIICAAELVRLREPAFESRRADPFAIGFLGLVPGQRGEAQLLRRCPACNTDSVRLERDAARLCTLHCCAQRECAFPDGRLPVFSGMDAVARFLPLAVLGTADAISGPAGEVDLDAVMGNVNARCPNHGYCHDHCRQNGCVQPLATVNSSDISRPAMFVPDHRRPVPVRTIGTLSHGHSV